MVKPRFNGTTGLEGAETTDGQGRADEMRPLDRLILKRQVDVSYNLGEFCDVLVEHHAEFFR